MTLKDFESHQYIPNVLTATAMSRVHTAEKSFSKRSMYRPFPLRPWMYHKTLIGDVHPILLVATCGIARTGLQQILHAGPSNDIVVKYFYVYSSSYRHGAPSSDVASIILVFETQKLCLRKQDGRIPGLVPHPPHLRYSQG